MTEPKPSTQYTTAPGKPVTAWGPWAGTIPAQCQPVPEEELDDCATLDAIRAHVMEAGRLIDELLARWSGEDGEG